MKKYCVSIQILAYPTLGALDLCSGGGGITDTSQPIFAFNNGILCGYPCCRLPL